jgi:hypothetical protein
VLKKALAPYRYNFLAFSRQFPLQTNSLAALPLSPVATLVPKPEKVAYGVFFIGYNRYYIGYAAGRSLQDFYLEVYIFQLIK